ncbi:hypothetical protein [Bacillus thuringiensis]|nr:hypothetical protein [Bacillus thuringiensis]AMR06101.1 hypothetical protein AXW78_28840 [Bacillus thuringiensis]PNK34685.1 hypothetical protein CBR55_28965 [Bacillus thuringiensis]
MSACSSSAQTKNDSRPAQALETMYEMRGDFENLFPLKLKEKGYDWEDINDWILSIETAYSKHGNKLVIN